jgi:hypothetical protein
MYNNKRAFDRHNHEQLHPATVARRRSTAPPAAARHGNFQ